MTKPKHQQMDWRGLEVLADEFTGTIALSDLSAVVALTDSTSGTPSTTTVAAISAATAATTDTSAASLASVNTALGQIRNDLATLTAKLNVVLNALK